MHNNMESTVATRLPSAAKWQSITVIVLLTSTLLISYENILEEWGVSVNPGQSYVTFALHSINDVPTKGSRDIHVFGSSRVQLGISPVQIEQETSFKCVNHAIPAGSGIWMLTSLESRLANNSVVIIEVLPEQTYLDHESSANKQIKAFSEQLEIVADFDLSTSWHMDSCFRFRNREVGMNRVLNAGARLAVGLDPKQSIEQEETYFKAHDNGFISSADRTFFEDDWKKNRAPVFQRLMQKLSNAQSAQRWKTSVVEFRLLVNRLSERNIRVLFIRMPSSDIYAEWEEQYYPRALYWDALQAEFGDDTLHFKDHPEMATFSPVDGSHLFGDEPAKFSRTLGKWVAERLKAQSTDRQ